MLYRLCGMSSPLTNASAVGNRNQINCVAKSVSDGIIPRHPVCSMRVDSPTTLQTMNSTERMMSTFALNEAGKFNETNNGSVETPVLNLTTRIAYDSRN